MKTIETLIEPITGYLISITRNAMEGWYELQIGIPKGWVFNENKEIKCEILNEAESGKIIKISPKNPDIVIDDLISFVGIIMETNKKIAEKEKEFTDRMTTMKENLEKEVKAYYEELDKMRADSFNDRNADFEKNLRPETEKEKRHRRTKAEIEAEKLISNTGDTTVITNNTSGATETTKPAIKIDLSRTA
jgi:hypothetical protein